MRKLDFLTKTLITLVVVWVFLMALLIAMPKVDASYEELPNIGRVVCVEKNDWFNQNHSKQCDLFMTDEVVR